MLAYLGEKKELQNISMEKIIYVTTLISIQQ
uniref:Uncharacterized protein n=1 Tax=Arundo donax TaxID=35708 RepID=A0A0A9H3G8_ARUDO